MCLQEQALTTTITIITITIIITGADRFITVVGNIRGKIGLATRGNAG